MISLLPFHTKSVSLLGGVLCVFLTQLCIAQNEVAVSQTETVESGPQTAILVIDATKEQKEPESRDVRFNEKLEVNQIQVAGLPATLPELYAVKDYSAYISDTSTPSQQIAYQSFLVSTDLLRKDPLDKKQRALQARSLMQLGKTGLASEVMHFTQFDDTTDGELTYFLSAYRAMEGNVTDAALLMRKAMQLDPTITLDRMAGDPDFQNMRSSKEYVSFFVHNLDPEELRINNWRSDLSCMASQVVAIHTNLFEKVNKETWEREIAKLDTDIPDLNNYTIAMEFTRIIAMANDPNTFLFPPINGPYKFNQLPVMFYPFDDGIYIRSASPKYAEVVGGKVVEIGGVKTQDALKRIQQYIPHQNEQTLKWMTPILLAIPEYLYGAGLADNMVQIPMKVVDTTNALVTVYFNAQRLYMDLLLTRTDHPTWPSARRKGQAPLYQKNPNDPWWFEYNPEKNIVYMQYNFLMDKQDQSTRNYIDQLIQTIENKKADALIIDVRQNNMLNETASNSLLVDAIKRTSLGANGKVIILQSHMTSGPASNLMAKPSDCSSFVYAGDKNTGGAAFNRKDASIFLPNSQLLLSVTSESFKSQFDYDINSQKETTIKAGLTFDQYRNNQDPLLDAVYRYLGK